jgi:hypothetical protein
MYSGPGHARIVGGRGRRSDPREVSTGKDPVGSAAAKNKSAAEAKDAAAGQPGTGAARVCPRKSGIWAQELCLVPSEQRESRCLEARAPGRWRPPRLPPSRGPRNCVVRDTVFVVCRERASGPARGPDCYDATLSGQTALTCARSALLASRLENTEARAETVKNRRRIKPASPSGPRSIMANWPSGTGREIFYRLSPRHPECSRGWYLLSCPI